MISVIICSRYSILPIELEQNILQTAGAECQIIHIDNSRGDHSIFTAYNLGIKKAKFEYLCFIHEDVKIHTMNWAYILQNHLDVPGTGVVGLAGAHLVPSAVTSWGFSPFQSMNYLQRIIPDKPPQHFYVNFCKTEKSSTHVIAIDGFFIAANKSLFNLIHFDANTFSGFHCYDIDLSLQSHALGLNNKVIFDILIEHFSKGFFDRKWLYSSKLLFHKWINQLPFTTFANTKKQLGATYFTNSIWLARIILHTKAWRDFFIIFSSLTKSFKSDPFVLLRAHSWRVILWFAFKCPSFKK